LSSNTHHDAFTVGWSAGRTRAGHQLVADLRLDASVLRDAMLGDGHVRLDFQPRDDGGLQPFRRRLHFVQQAVNAVAQGGIFFQRLPDGCPMRAF